MSVQTTRDVYAGLKKGGTWGTEGDVTSAGINLFASSITLNAEFQEALARDFGQGGKLTDVRRLAFNVSGSITCDLTYGQGWLALFQGVMGTESSPTETTASQGDYLVNHDVADTNYGLFWTLGYSIESDRTISIYSMKIMSAKFDISPNSQGSVTFQFIADQAVEGSSNTVPELQALTRYTYEMATLGGANHYFRINTYSTVTPLSGTHNKAITNISFEISRSMNPLWALRGSATRYCIEPLDFTTRGTLTVTHSELDNATYDMLTHWSGLGGYMAEFFIDGDQIGSGVNSSLKFQFPYLKPTGKLPTHHDVPNNSTIRNPSLTYHMLKAAAAPNGMTGVTDLMRLAEIHRVRSTKWSA